MKHFARILLLLIALQVAGISPLFADSPPAMPNLVFIFCDNLGYGDIEPFGSKVNRTPCLNRMAREGRKFTHFYATSGVCTPSRASLMTGCYAQRVGMHLNPRDGQVLRPISPYGLNPKEITIAEVLKSAGYQTAIVGKWHLGDQPEFLPTRQGFDSFFGIPYSDDMTQAMGKRLGDRLDGAKWPPLPLMQNETVTRAPVDRSLLTKRYTERALAVHRAVPRATVLSLYAPSHARQHKRTVCQPRLQGQKPKRSLGRCGGRTRLVRGKDPRQTRRAETRSENPRHLDFRQRFPARSRCGQSPAGQQSAALRPRLYHGRRRLPRANDRLVARPNPRRHGL